MKIELKPMKFESLDGFSEKQIKEHYKLYEDYVAKIIEIGDKLARADEKKANPTLSELRSLKVAETFAVNGAKLHESYFTCLGGDGVLNGRIEELIRRDFKSPIEFKEKFTAIGLAVRGWVILAYDPDFDKLVIYGTDAHDTAVWRGIPLLALDVYEHAYFMDFGKDRKAYIEAFLRNIDWNYINTLIRVYNL